MTETNPYTFVDNPTESGVAVCNTDILNDDIMCLKWMHDHISFRNIGEIVASTIPLTDAGLHLLDGSLLQYGSYQAFIDYIADLYDSGDYSAIFDTEANWQSSVTTYGVCGKFVYDSVNNTVRLPKITGIVEGTTDVTALGDLIEAGLPNITGSIKLSPADSYNSDFTGCFTGSDSAWSASLNSGVYHYSRGNFDASRSSSIYGNSNTVQPQAVKVLYYIVIATTTKTDIQVDIDEIVTDLNGKVDKADLAEVQCVVETYQNGTSWYRVYSDGWCEQGGVISAVTTTLLKPYIDTNYIVLQGFVAGTDGDWFITNKTTTSFTQKIKYYGSGESNSSTSNYWQACGYIA